jgi:hypothetical protein
LESFKFLWNPGNEPLSIITNSDLKMGQIVPKLSPNLKPWCMPLVTCHSPRRNIFMRLIVAVWVKPWFSWENNHSVVRNSSFSGEISWRNSCFADFGHLWVIMHFSVA